MHQTRECDADVQPQIIWIRLHLKTFASYRYFVGIICMGLYYIYSGSICYVKFVCMHTFVCMHIHALHKFTINQQAWLSIFHRE